MSSYEEIISTSILSALAVLAVLFILRGVFKGWVKALLTTGNITLSAFLACFVSRDLTMITRDYLYPLVVWVIGLFGVHIEEFFAGYEDLINLLPLIVSVILTPFIFLAIFFLFHGIIGFVLLFVYKSKVEHKSPDDGSVSTVKRYVPWWSRLIGGLIGVVNAALMLAVVLVPVIGYANMVTNVADEYFDGVDTTTYVRNDGNFNSLIYFAVEDYVSPITDHWFTQATYHTFGRPMFNHLSGTVYHEISFTLESEAIATIHLLRNSVDFISSDMTQMNAESIEQLHGIIHTLDESALMPEVMAMFLADASKGWINNDSAFGVPKPDFGELLNPTFNVLLHILATTERETLIADLDTLVDVLGLMVDSKMFENIRDTGEMMSIMSSGQDLVQKMMQLFESNEHLKPMAAEIQSLCVRALTQTLDLDNLELTGQLTDSINAFKDDPEQLSQELASIVQGYLDDQNMSATISPEITNEVADAISKEFAGQENVTEQDVIDFVLDYAAGAYTDENGNIDLDGDGIPDGNIEDDLPPGIDIGDYLP